MASIFDLLDTFNGFSQTGIVTSDDDPRWGDQVHQASILKAWFVFIEELIMLVAIAFTACYIFCYQKNLTSVVVIQMALLGITYVGFNIGNTWKTLTNQLSGQNSELPNWIWYTYSVAFALWLTQHWIFTAQYLKVALIFELAFCVKTSAVVAKKHERERCFIIVNILAYLILFFNLIAMVTWSNRLIVTIVYSVSSIFMTGFLTYSMSKLQKFSSLVAANGILASRFLLILHLGGWWIATILQTTIAVISIILASQTKADDFSHTDLALW